MAEAASTQENPMRKIFIDRVVLSVGTGSDAQIQSNAKKLLETITSKKVADAVSRKRNPSFKITKGQKIGAFVTVRKADSKKLVARLLGAVDNRIRESSVTSNSLSFGIKEYIDISGIKYDPKIGMLGMNVAVSFKRPGNRVALRKRRRADVPESHRVIKPEEIKDYMVKEFGVSFA